MITELTNFATTHQAATLALGTGAVHAAHLIWPRLVGMYPYCRDNGGVAGILRNFFKGKAVAPLAPTNTNEPTAK